MSNTLTANNFRYWLFTASKIANPENLTLLDADFKSSVLAFGSRHFYNLEMVNRVAWSQTLETVIDNTTFQTYGLKLLESNLLVSRVPILLMESFPNKNVQLAESDWKAFLLLIHTILKVLERSESEIVWGEGESPFNKHRSALQLYSTPALVGTLEIADLNAGLMSALDFSAIRYTQHIHPKYELSDIVLSDTIEYGLVANRNKLTYGFKLKKQTLGLESLWNKSFGSLTELKTPLSEEELEASMVLIELLLRVFQTPQAGD